MEKERDRLGLLIVDVQKAMLCCDGGVWDGFGTVARIGSLLETARSCQAPVVFVQHTELGSEFDPAEETWQICEEIAPQPGEPVIEKRYLDSFYKTDLAETAERLGVKRWIVVGMQTEYCMDTTIRNGFSRGFELYGVKGCHSTFDSGALKAEAIIGHHEAIWNGRFLKMLSLEKGLDMLTGRPAACER